MQPSEAAAQGGARDPGGMLRRGYLKTDETHRRCRPCCMIGTGEGNLLRPIGYRGQNGCRGFRLVRDTSGCPGRLAEGAHCRAVVGHDPYQGRAGQGRAGPGGRSVVWSAGSAVKQRYDRVGSLSWPSLAPASVLRQPQSCDSLSLAPPPPCATSATRRLQPCRRLRSRLGPPLGASCSGRDGGVGRCALGWGGAGGGWRTGGHGCAGQRAGQDARFPDAF